MTAAPRLLVADLPRQCELYFSFRRGWDPDGGDFARLEFVLECHLQPAHDFAAIRTLNFRLLQQIQAGKPFIYILFKFMNKGRGLGHRV